MTSMAQHGSALPSLCATETPGQGGVASGGLAVTGHSWGMQDLGWQHSRAWQSSMLENISFKTWTQKNLEHLLE